MNKKNLQYITGCIALSSVLYISGVFNVFASFFEEKPTSGYNCSEYGYFVGYGYGYDCTVKGGGGASSVSSTVGSTTTTTTTTETEDEETEDTDSTDEEGTTDDSSTEGSESETSDDNSDNPYEGDEEIQDAYDFGFENGLTTQPLEKARLYEGLTRFELAKMMSAFIKNVAKVEAVDNAMCDISKYTDYASFDDEMKIYIKMACDYGIMGWKNDKSGIIDAFRPNDSVTREEFAAVLSRYLFGSEHDGKDMKAHLEALRDAEIMNQIDNPFVVEVRGYVLLMLKRVAMEEKEVEVDDSSSENSQI